MAKGKVTIDEARCQGCGLCVSFCNFKVLSLHPKNINAKGYHPASVEKEDACTGCAMCALMCPDVAIKVERGESNA